MTEATVELERLGKIARLTLCNPMNRNAITEHMRDTIYLALEAVEIDPTIRVLTIKGCGPDFSSGADLREFGRSTDVYEARRTRALRSIFNRILAFPRPTVAAVSGVAVGGGLELVLACDVRIADPTARFGLPEVRRGFIPGGGGTQLVTRRAGPSQRWDQVLSGELIDAPAAHRLGWVHEVCTDRPDLERRVTEIERRLADLEPDHVATALQILRRDPGLESRVRNITRVRRPA